MKLKDETKKEAIFNATISLAGSVGISGLRMSDIAKEANVASGTLYVYFQSKEELLNALYRELKKGGSLSILNNLKGQPVKVQLFEIWKQSLKYRIANQAETIFLEQFMVSPFITDSNKKLNQQFSNYITDLLDQGKEEMIIKNTDNSILMSVLTGYIRDLSIHLASNKIELTDQIINESFSISWDAIKA